MNVCRHGLSAIRGLSCLSVLLLALAGLAGIAGCGGSEPENNTPVPDVQPAQPQALDANAPSTTGTKKLDL